MFTIAGKAAYWSVIQTGRFFGTELLWIQWAIALIAVLYVVFGGPVPERLVAKGGAFLRSLARRRKTAVFSCAALCLGLRAAVLPLVPVPLPSVHDEFSQLLLGDTLASGRLTNPTHPLWPYFESIHVIQRPTYNSMYPPGSGAFLALGEKLAGEPWLGVWLSAGLMCAGICWMLQGWLPPVWALTGGLLAVFTIGIPGFWMNSYIGGAVPALGGALAMGSLARLTRGHRTITAPARCAVTMAVGFSLLLVTRPFEGGILGGLTLVALVSAWTRQGVLVPRISRPALIVPFCAVMAGSIAFTGYYCWRVTKNPLKMPYEVNRETYGWPENLAILPPVRVTLRAVDLESMRQLEVSHRQAYSSFGRVVDSMFYRLVTAWNFYAGPVLTAPLLFLPYVLIGRTTRVAVLIGLAMCGVNLLQLMLYPQHLAAIAGLIFLVITQGLRYLRRSVAIHRPLEGGRLAVALTAAVLLASGAKLFAAPLGIQRDFWDEPREGERDARAALVSSLSSRSRPQLVLVRYRPDHNPNQEWVYNAADIDHSKIVWARESDPGGDRVLLSYFSGREVWLLDADAAPPRLTAYPQPESDPGPSAETYERE